MNNNHKLQLFFIFALLISSCKSSGEQMWISIRNETTREISCDLDLQDQSANGFSDKITIPAGEYDDIYGSSEVTKDPIKLFKVYKALKVALNDADSTILEFNSWKEPENYTQNPFTDTSAWHLTIFEMDFPTNMSSSEETIWNYEFVITEENVIK